MVVGLLPAHPISNVQMLRFIDRSYVVYTTSQEPGATQDFTTPVRIAVVAATNLTRDTLQRQGSSHC